MSRTTLLATVAGLGGLIAAGFSVAHVWAQLGVTMSLHGWIAYGLGAMASLALSAILFALVFRSARDGHDDIDRPEDLSG